MKLKCRHCGGQIETDAEVAVDEFVLCPVCMKNLKIDNPPNLPQIDPKTVWEEQQRIEAENNRIAEEFKGCTCQGCDHFVTRYIGGECKITGEFVCCDDGPCGDYEDWAHPRLP